MRILLLILLIPTLLWAEDRVLIKVKDKENIIYPTADTAIRKGKTYRLLRASDIYQKIDKAKDIKEKKK